MLERILRFSIQQRWLMLALAVGIAALGAYNMARLPIDAVPDITNNQVVVNTLATALSPEEIEKQITFPVESAMGGIPGVQNVRSLSRYGLSQVTVIFDDNVDIYRARQLVNERLVDAKDNLPAGASPTMGPVATGLGEIYMWAVEAKGTKKDGSPYTPTDLRTIQEWVIKPQLRTVAGVTEINTIGGFERQYHVLPDPMKLIERGIGFRDVLDALVANNTNAGGGYVEHRGEQYLIRATGLIQSIDDIGNIKLGATDGIPFFIKDVADIQIGHELRTGAATLSGKETVIGTAIMLIGENSRVISERVDKKLSSINKTLPEGVSVRTLYDRTYLVEATLQTVKKNLFEGAVLVIAVLFLLLGNFRAAFIVALAIPLSMLFAISGMVQGKISGNLMSLGAIDFGLIVDSSVILIENIMRRLAEEQQHLGRLLTRAERIEVVRDASIEVRKPTLYGELIIAIVYLPILTLVGIEGKMFVPMAQVVILALAGALLLSFTVIPAFAALLLTGKIKEQENVLIVWAKAIYSPILNTALRFRWATLGLAIVIFAASAALSTRLGAEFVPRLNEGAFTIEGSRIPSISLTSSLEMQAKLERALAREFPDEVAMVFSRIGTAEIATDPMGVNSADTFIMLKPQHQWKKAHTQEELGQQLAEVLNDLPGDAGEFQQPIEMRFNEMLSGIKGDVAVKIYGDDMAELLELGEKVEGILKKVPGAADIKVEQVAGLPMVNIDIDRKAIARFGLNVKDVQDVVRIAMGGESAGQIIEGDRRFNLVVQLPERLRNNIDTIQSLPIPLSKSQEDSTVQNSLPTISTSSISNYISLGSVAKIRIEEGPNQISREDGRRRLVVQCNVRVRDIGSFVDEAQHEIEKQMGRLPEGYWMGWGGQFEHLIAAKQRLMIVVPIALVLIFAFLFATFNSSKHAMLVFTGVPLALTGGVFSLWLRGIPFSISAAVGFIALSGVAVLNGMVMMTFINQLRQEGHGLKESIIQGSLMRLRPVLMTALVASLGFIPMAIATGTGAEVQRPLATVVIGGLVSSTLLTLVVLPVLFLITHRELDSSQIKETHNG